MHTDYALAGCEWALLLLRPPLRERCREGFRSGRPLDLSAFCRLCMLRMISFLQRTDAIANPDNGAVGLECVHGGVGSSVRSWERTAAVETIYV